MIIFTPLMTSTNLCNGLQVSKDRQADVRHHGHDGQIVAIAASAEKAARFVKYAQLKVHKGGSHGGAEVDVWAAGWPDAFSRQARSNTKTAVGTPRIVISRPSSSTSVT